MKLVLSNAYICLCVSVRQVIVFRGHKDIPGNEAADELVIAAAAKNGHSLTSFLQVLFQNYAGSHC